MNKITAIRTYNLVDAQGNHLQLVLGRYDRRSDVHIVGPDQGFRWMFRGTAIPMPVRSETWFNGFPEATMIDWLNENDWYVHTSVNMMTGEAVVWDVPEFEEYHDGQMALDEAEFNKHLKDLYDNGKTTLAIHLYRYAHEVSTKTAVNAVMEICK